MPTVVMVDVEPDLSLYGADRDPEGGVTETLLDRLVVSRHGSEDGVVRPDVLGEDRSPSRPKR